jgi:hypothetical protein
MRRGENVPPTANATILGGMLVATLLSSEERNVDIRVEVAAPSVTSRTQNSFYRYTHATSRLCLSSLTKSKNTGVSIAFVYYGNYSLLCSTHLLYSNLIYSTQFKQ